jgi:hypothetical protein
MNNLTPWLESFGNERLKLVQAFTAIFNKLDALGFTLNNPDAIDGGYRLEFRKGEAWATVDRYLVFPVQGECPGIALYCDSREFECVLSIRTPLELILKSIAVLAHNEAGKA